MSASGVPPTVPAQDDVFVFPASCAQARLWFLAQLAPESTNYNVPVAIRLRGELDVPVLESCLTEIVRRHEVLRATFAGDDGVPVQVVRPVTAISLPVHDIASAEMDRAVAGESRRPFDLSVGPLFRPVLLRRAERDHTLVLTFHHAVFDGWSLGIFCDELSELYRALRTGTAARLSELELQYADYAVWQQDMVERDEFAAQLRYWRTQLAGVPARLELPTDRPRPAVASFAGGQFEFTVSKDFAARLHALARSEQATLFMVLVAGFQVLLSRWSGQTDICLGSPVAGRTHSELTGLIGFFVNTVVLRGDLSGPASFREVLRRTRSTTLAAYDHQDVPFDQIVEELRPERSLSHTPLFQVMLVLQNTSAGELSLPGLDARLSEPPGDTTKFDLTLTVEEELDGGLVAVFEYAADLFDAGTIAALAQRFQVLLTAALADPDARIDQLDLLLPGEWSELVSARNDTAHRVPATRLPDLVQARAVAAPDAVAVVCGADALSYRDLTQRSNQLARVLLDAGAGPGELVGVSLDRSADLVVALLAVLKSGAGYLPLDPALPEERTRFMVDDARPVLVLREIGDLSGQSTSDISDAHRPRPLTDGDRAYVIYTSGSTGRPKGVELPHAAVANQLQWLATEYPLAVEDVMLARTSIGFDASVCEIWLPLVCGATICLAPEEITRDVAELLAYAGRHGVTTAQFVPSMLAALPADADRGRLRRIFSGGEALPTAVARRVVSQWDVELVNLYGPTETTVQVTSARYDDRTPGGTVPLGSPVWNTRVYVLDRAMRPVPDGVAGELHIGGSQLALGYLGRAALTAERFVPDPFGPEGARLYRTGDLCRWHRDDRLEYLGRTDHQVKIRGYRIELGEIEVALAGHPAVRRAAVLARADTSGDRRLVAYLLPADAAAPPSSSDVREYLARSLPAYLVPSVFVVLNTWPTTTNGKLDRAALPAPEVDPGVPHLPPETPTEQLVAEVWAEILRVDRVGLLDNLFDLGGHSLSAARIASRIGSVYGKPVSVAVVFQAPTVRQLASWLDDTMAPDPWSPVVPMHAAGDRPPLFLVHPVGGNVLCYAGLSGTLGQEQPVHALTARGFGVGQDAVADLEVMAADYVAAIAEFGQDGPFVLGGWSMGGVIAFEMARQLHRDTGLVVPLVLIDSHAPGQHRSVHDDVASLVDFAGDWGRSVGIDLELSVDALAELTARQRIQYLLERATALGAIGADEDAEFVGRLAHVFSTNVAALRGYAPPSGAPAPALLLAARDENDGSGDPAHGWRRWVGGGVDVRSIPGDHYSMMGEPNLSLLVAELRSGLDRLWGSR